MEPAHGSTVLVGWGTGGGQTAGTGVRGTVIRAGAARGDMAAVAITVDVAIMAAAAMRDVAMWGAVL